MRPLIILSCMLFASTAFAAPSLDRTYGNIPLAFTVNEGQAPASIRFTARGSGCGMVFSPSGTTFLLSRETAGSVARRAAKKSVVFENDPTKDQPEYESFALNLSFIGANENPEIQGEDRLSWNNNYFIGNDPSQWRTDVPNYKKIRFKEVYTGIDLVYYGNQKRVKYDFVVKPGEDTNKILLKYDFGEAGGTLSVNDKGELVVKTPVGELIEEKPYCYEKINGKEVEVAIAYEVVEGGTYRFRVGEYDKGKELVIDPEVVYSTYLGGAGEDSVGGMAVDSQGCVYLTGECAPHFPVTPAAYDTTYHKVFVCKINPTGTALEYSTYLGGSGNDVDHPSIAIDNFGNAYVAGRNSTSDFPTTPNAFDTEPYSGKCFITKFNPKGNGLIYSTMLGGKSGGTDNEAIAVNSAGEVFITGESAASDFPTTLGAYEQFQSNYFKVFVSKINSDGSKLVYSTTLKEAIYSFDIAIDKEGNAYITGQTPNNTFPVTPNAYSKPFGGRYDVFMTKFNPDGSALVYSTIIGGGETDTSTGIALDSKGAAYICGYTESSNYPTTAGSFQQNYTPEDENGFVTKLSPDGGSLAYSTYISGKSDTGSKNIEINDIVVDSYNTAYIIGYSNMPNYPVTSDALIKIKKGSWDSIFSVINSDGKSLVYSSYWGGSSGEDGLAVCIGNSGDVYLSGVTGSFDFPTTPEAICDSLTYEYYGQILLSQDLFISKIDLQNITYVEESFDVILHEFKIISIYPNPFNPSTTINFYLPESDKVRLSIYSILGQEVYKQQTGILKSGLQRLRWDGRDQYNKRVSSGVYLIKLSCNNTSLFEKVLLLK